MRELVGRARARIRDFIENNAWVPLAGKAFGIAGSLVLLSAIGAGVFDRTFDLGPPRAEAAVPRRPPQVATSRVAAPGPSASSPLVPARDGAAAKPPAPTAKIVLNDATAAELERLPGVGPAKAQAILALRTKLGGRFKRFEDLLRVRGIKRRALSKIREHAVLDAPPPDAPPSSSASASAAPRAPAPLHAPAP